MWQIVGLIATFLALIITIIALIVTILALAASAIFYVKSARELRHVSKVIIDYLQMAMNKPGIKPNPGKYGIPKNWNSTLGADEGFQDQVADSPTLTQAKKKPE